MSAARIALVLVVVVVSFLFGAWWGAKDRLCVTADSPFGPVVYCGQGEPAGQLLR